MEEKQAHLVDLGLPDGIIVKGGIPISQKSEDLVGDMLEIDLPDGTTLDVGWVPENMTDGAYRLKIYKQYWSNTVQGPFYFKSTEDVVEEVKRIVGWHNSEK